MSRQKKLEMAAGATFMLCLPLVVIFCRSSLQKIWAKPEASGIIGWYGTAWFFLTIFLPLTLADRRKRGGITPLLTCLTYGWWWTWVTLDLATIFYLRQTRWGGIWIDEQDSAMLLASLFTFLAVVAVGMWGFRWNLNDPYLRAGMAISWKTVGQLVMAVIFLSHSPSAASWGLDSLLSGVLTISLRLLQVAFSVFVDGWTEERKAMVATEGSNLPSWLAVIAAWRQSVPH